MTLAFTFPVQLAAQSNLVQLISPQGDYIGQGGVYVTDDEAEFSASGTAATISVSAFGFAIVFDAPGNELLAAGSYGNAIRYPFNGQQPGITVYGNGRGCNTVTGDFEVLELQTDSSGNVDRIWVRFNHSCEGFMPAMTGEVRFHSALAPPEPSVRTLHVPAEYSSIQAAIEAAGLFGDTVLVAAGEYPEAIDFRGKNLIVRSESGPELTILAPPAGPVAVTFRSSESASAELRGFTLRDASGGIYVTQSAPTIVSNIIERCGSGIDCYFASPTIRANRIRESFAGSGIHLGGAAAAIVEGNVVEGNQHGITMFAAGNPIILNNLIRNNQGDGINMVNRSDADILQNVIVHNDGHGIAWLVPSGARGPEVKHNTIFGNGRVSGAGILADGYDANALVVNNMVQGRPALNVGGFNDSNPPILHFNNFYAAEGPTFSGLIGNLAGVNGNISEPPGFLAPSLSDFRLLSSSPCVEAGDPNRSLPIDFEGNPRPTIGPLQPDLGAFEYIAGPPRPATLLSASAGPTEVRLDWLAFDDAYEYLVRRSLDSGGPYLTIGTVSSNHFVDGTAEQDVIYHYVVAGVNAYGVGGNSVETAIQAGNHPPRALDDSIMIVEDGLAMIDVLANDIDENNDVLIAELLSAPGNGVALFDGSIASFVPTLDFFGTNSFLYIVRDGRGGVATGVVSVVVLPVNDPPRGFAVNIPVQSGTQVSSPLGAVDVDSTILTFHVTLPPSHGLASLNESTGILSYRPVHRFSGIDTLYYVVSDGESISPEMPVGLQVVAPTDLDFDSMADLWEIEWDLNNAFGDPDGDGVTSFEEYVANTNPRDSSSFLRVTETGTTLGGHPFIRWDSVGGTRYRIRSTDQLMAEGGAFLPVERPVTQEMDPSPTGQPSSQVFVDNRPLSATGTRFYRVEVVQ